MPIYKLTFRDLILLISCGIDVLIGSIYGGIYFSIIKGFSAGCCFNSIYLLNSSYKLSKFLVIISVTISAIVIILLFNLYNLIVIIEVISILCKLSFFLKLDYIILEIEFVEK